ncbi:hypothetical protein ONZ45_g16128 [Pleurotus djamor]|nr:hypothetical protein ONZ45_g16128 [Pleurotus djamor]
MLSSIQNSVSFMMSLSSQPRTGRKRSYTPSTAGDVPTKRPRTTPPAKLNIAPPSSKETAMSNPRVAQLGTELDQAPSSHLMVSSTSKASLAPFLSTSSSLASTRGTPLSSLQPIISVGSPITADVSSRERLNTVLSRDTTLRTVPSTSPSDQSPRVPSSTPDPSPSAQSLLSRISARGDHTPPTKDAPSSSRSSGSLLSRMGVSAPVNRAVGDPHTSSRAGQNRLPRPALVPCQPAPVPSGKRSASHVDFDNGSGGGGAATKKRHLDPLP